MAHMKKPGVFKRATIAWFMLNAVLVITLAVTVYMVSPWMDSGYVVVPLLIAFIGAEWWIMAETLAPIVRDWIRQEEYVSDGNKPSWDRE